MENILEAYSMFLGRPWLKQIKVHLDWGWRAPNSLRVSNVSPKWKTTEEQGVEAHSLTRSSLEG
jgi:hypothetical protein